MQTHMWMELPMGDRGVVNVTLVRCPGCREGARYGPRGSSRLAGWSRVWLAKDWRE